MVLSAWRLYGASRAPPASRADRRGSPARPVRAHRGRGFAHEAGFFASAALSIACGLGSAQAPVLSPVQLLPGDGAIGPAAGDQRSPALVPGGGGFLAVWEDARTDLVPNLLADQGGFDVCAARLDAFGTPIDLLPIAVSETFGDQTRPRAAWNGQDWLVVWVNQEPIGAFYGPAVRAARVSPAGVLLDATPILLPL
ncbi:MAG: hypothetical protein ACREIU_01890, partial [Planctomycetota bacterium]